MAKPVAFAVGAHPDDIEFMMAGTLLMLGRAGYELHTMNICNGSCGTAVEDREAIIARRTAEAREAARSLGAHFHEPLVDDIDLFYEPGVLHRVAAVVRDVKPAVLLTASPQDYMEDHMTASRVAVTAAFCRGMRNFPTDPPRPPIDVEVTVYHALPWGLSDSLRRVVRAGQYVDIAPVLEQKRAALACHKSQKEWLDSSQGLDSYLTTMEEMSREVGKQSGQFEYAEGWRRHLHLGFCSEAADPLSEAVGKHGIISRAYEDGPNRA
ncbi:MAG TPA: PIG-L family deacetylase [Candidatus Bathyarchaeia archaeon]|nr:PIG-L family deacetylase [Candidatus Bathyarchaeia archaeon]